ncbi:MAG TPA: DUF2332 domain-containing protein [Caulobacteraceae bacterium]|jgi:hypothetical protein
MADDPLLRAVQAQAAICASFGSRFYAGLMQEMAADLDDETRALFAPWEGLTFEGLLEAAATLRFLGALHDLALTGADPFVAATFPPATDTAAAWQAVRAAIMTHRGRIEAFMAHEPQTNEVRRSACLLPGFLTIAAETGLPLSCVELGASAGLNQLWHAFGYDYGAAGRWGDASEPLQLTADWTGPPPPLDAPLKVVASRACDRKPIAIADPAERARLCAYLWPDQTERIERFNAAADMAIAAGTVVEEADALDFVRAHAAPKPGVATVVFHSIFWQYLPAELQAAITDALATHGARATAEAPLAWLRMEAEPGKPMPIELRLTLWPGGQDRRLAIVHAHGATVDWGA